MPADRHRRHPHASHQGTRPRNDSLWLRPENDDQEVGRAVFVGLTPPRDHLSEAPKAGPSHIVRATSEGEGEVHDASFIGISPAKLPRTTYYIGRPPPSRLSARSNSLIRFSSPDHEEVVAGIIGAPLHGPSTSASTTAHSSPEPIAFYEQHEDEIEETAELQIPGETVFDDDDSASEDSEDKEVPVRVLTEFTLYERGTRRIIPFEELLSKSDQLEANNYGASGQVWKWVEKDEDDNSNADDENEVEDLEENSEAVIKLTVILEVNVHNVEESESDEFMLDPRIWIRTRFAWYILYVPSPAYKLCYAPFWIKARLFHYMVTSVWESRRMSYETFLDELPASDASDCADDILGQTLSSVDFELEETRAYIISTFNDMCSQDGLDHLKSLRKTYVFRRVFPEDDISVGLAKGRATSQRRLRDVVKQKRKPEPEKTVVTPGIYDIAKGLFHEKLMTVVGTTPSREASTDDPRLPHHSSHREAIESASWVDDSHLGHDHYKSVFLDGICYDAGDVIMVQIGADDNKKRRTNAASSRSQSTNPLANTKWFAKICYFFEDDDRSRTKMFHAQWFQHGAQIMLQETAHPQGLFLLDECEDQPVDAIYRKANVRVLDATEEEPGMSSVHNNFFTGVMWDEKNNVFFQRREADIEAALEKCKSWKPCASCGRDKLRSEQESWSVTPTGTLRQGDTRYHKQDFVYIRPEELQHRLYIIGQIERIKCYPSDDGEEMLTVDVRVYKRLDVLIREEYLDEFGAHKSDERHLYKTNEILDGVHVDRIEGKVFVVHPGSMAQDELKQWLDQDDHFYADKFTTKRHPRKSDFEKLSPSGVRNCSKCFHARQDALREEDELKQSHRKLRGLELFAGAGGLSAGLDQAGFVETKWAVEWTTSAALTYAENHPHSIVYNQSVNACLKHAIDSFEGANPPPLPSRDAKARRKLPPMPKPGEVDLIYGGPPCQGFSKMNHTKKPDDYRNTLVANMISYVDFYRPKFFLLENVLGILEWRGNMVTANGRTNGGVEMGALKFVIRSMTSLGYQVHYRLLDAGQYGAPQSRRRVIILGAKRDCPLPMFPVPTHATPKDVIRRKLPTGDALYPVVRYRPHDADLDDKDVHIQFAPHLFVTVEDAISDLPQFDWRDPHIMIKRSIKDIRIENSRRDAGFPAFDATTAADADHCGFVDPTRYAHRPQNRYQQWMRSHASSQLYYHYTGKWGPKIVERTVNIPMVADANHDQLPPSMRLHNMLESNHKSKQAYVSLFQRIDGKGLFRTALTQVSPGCKGGTVLHPNQKRILTVRECARAQGFPDHWKFLSESEAPRHEIRDQLMQIGNAVPVPLALALGKAIGKAVMQMWREDDARWEAERARSPEIPQPKEIDNSLGYDESEEEEEEEEEEVSERDEEESERERDEAEIFMDVDEEEEEDSDRDDMSEEV